MAKKKIGVVLSGCGVYDGSEIHESVLLLLALKRKGYDVEFLAPDIAQAHVINHAAGAPAEGETRNVRVEASRIARGPVRDITTAKATEFDGIAFPGGFGAAKNLSNYAYAGVRMGVIPAVAKLVSEAHEARKPLLFICIAPMIAAKVLGPKGVSLTLGADNPSCGHAAALGANHVNKPVDECLVDTANRIVSVPAYMYHAQINEVADGIDKAVEAFAGLVG